MSKTKELDMVAIEAERSQVPGQSQQLIKALTQNKILKRLWIWYSTPELPSTARKQNNRKTTTHLENSSPDLLKIVS